MDLKVYDRICKLRIQCTCRRTLNEKNNCFSIEYTKTFQFIGFYLKDPKTHK